MRGSRATLASAAHRRDSAASRANRRTVARDQRDNDVVLGDDVVENGVVDTWAVAVRPWSLGYRERLLQHVGDALGFGPLLQARGGGDCQFPAHVVYRVCLGAKFLAAEPQAGGACGADLDWLGAGTG